MENENDTKKEIEFIRVNIYTLDRIDIIKEELYEPSGN